MKSIIKCMSPEASAELLGESPPDDPTIGECIELGWDLNTPGEPEDLRDLWGEDIDRHTLPSGSPHDGCPGIQHGKNNPENQILP